MSRPFMPFYDGDWMRDTAHLDDHQERAYFRLIMFYWANDGLPRDEKQIARICRADDARRWRNLRPILAPFFQISCDGKWTHKRIEVELEKSRKFIEKQRENGAKPKAKKEPVISQNEARARVPQLQPQATAAKAAAAAPPPLDLNELRRSCVEAAGQDFTKGFGMIAELAEAGHSVEDRILPIIREAAADLAARGEKARSWAYFAEAIMDEHRAAPAAPAPLVEHVWCEKGSTEFERGNAARVARGEVPWSGFPSRHHNGAVGASFPASDVREERVKT